MHACAYAAKGDQLEVLKWTRLNACQRDVRTFEWDASEGHLKVLEWHTAVRGTKRRETASELGYVEEIALRVYAAPLSENLKAFPPSSRVSLFPRLTQVTQTLTRESSTKVMPRMGVSKLTQL